MAEIIDLLYNYGIGIICVVETYGVNLEGWNIVDNLRDYICSNKYLK